jgi:ketosteroid isomerase-like protein
MNDILTGPRRPAVESNFAICGEAVVLLKRTIAAGSFLLLGVAITLAQQEGLSDDGGRVLALETAWNHAIEAKDSKAIDLLLADTMVAVESDGTFSTKKEYLAGIRAPDFQPSQAVNEQNNVQVYGNAAVAVGIFRIKGVEKGKPYLHRERTIDTWVKMNGTWKCVAAVAVSMPAKQAP